MTTPRSSSAAQPPPQTPSEAEAPGAVLGAERRVFRGVAHQEPRYRPICSFESTRERGDQAALRLAERQHGCVHRDQLAAAGIDKHALSRRLTNGRLHRIHRDVFLVGRSSPQPLSLEMAAVLHFKGYAVLGGRSAAALWGLLAHQPRPVEVTVLRRYSRAPAGVQARRAVSLGPEEVRWRQLLPLLSPVRTLLELACMLEPDELEATVASSIRHGLVQEPELQRWLDFWSHGTRGAATLRALVRGPDVTADTRSVYERKLLRLIRSARLPQPLTNTMLCGHLVDMHWPQQKLVVEVDGWEFHRDRASFEKDRRRDQDLAAAGQRVVRVTARHIDHEPARVTQTLRSAIAADSGGRASRR